MLDIPADHRTEMDAGRVKYHLEVGPGLSGRDGLYCQRLTFRIPLTSRPFQVLELGRHRHHALT